MTRSIIQKLSLWTRIVLLISIVFTGCDEDEKTAGTLDIHTFKASITAVKDNGDANDANDLEVKFNLAESNEQVSEYRIIYTKATSTIDIEQLKSLNTTQYTSVSGASESLVKQLNQGQLDIDGNAILLDVEYKIHILSIGLFNGSEVHALSDPSTSVMITDTSILKIEDYTVEIGTVLDRHNNNNAGDVLVTFDGASADLLISEYRIIAVKNTALTLVNTNSASEITAEKYTSVVGENSSYQTLLSTSQVDFEGGDIESDSEYQILILSVGTFNGETVYGLSNPSSTFQLIQNIETTTLVPDFRGNGAVDVDADGNIYVSEYGSNGTGTSAFKISPAGEVTEFVSNLSGPVGNAIDAQGNYYVNNGNNNVSGDFLKIDPAGNQTVIATINGYPSDILIGNAGDFYICNWSRPILHKVTANGTVTDFANDSRLSGGVGIDYDDAGNIIVGNFKTGEILSLDPDGVISSVATIPTVVGGFVIGYLTFFEGHIYATGYGSKIIYKVSLDTGAIEEFAGTGRDRSIDDELAFSSFVTPNGIAIDKTRRILYISQNGNGSAPGLRAILLE